MAWVSGAPLIGWKTDKSHRCPCWTFQLVYSRGILLPSIQSWRDGYAWTSTRTLQCSLRSSPSRTSNPCFTTSFSFILPVIIFSGRSCPNIVRKSKEKGHRTNSKWLPYHSSTPGSHPEVTLHHTTSPPHTSPHGTSDHSPESPAASPTLRC